MHWRTQLYLLTITSIFSPCTFVCHFPVRHFPALHFCPSFSSRALLSVIFQSCIFQPCTFVRHFPVRHFPVLHFQSPHLNPLNPLYQANNCHDNYVNFYPISGPKKWCHLLLLLTWKFLTNFHQNRHVVLATNAYNNVLETIHFTGCVYY